MKYSGGSVNFTISQDKRDKVVVFGEYADGSAYVELDVLKGINFYTGTLVIPISLLI